MKYKIKEYTFDDGRVWYKAFYKRFIFWHPITWCWALMNWTAWNDTYEDAKKLIDKYRREHTRIRYHSTNEVKL